MFGLFRSKLAKDLIQNHKDGPNFWEQSTNNFSMFRNREHKINLEFNRTLEDVYSVTVNSVEMKDRLSRWDKNDIVEYFREVYLISKLNIPTKVQNPEAFI